MGSDWEDSRAGNREWPGDDCGRPVGIVVNVLIGVWLHKDAKHDLNIRSAYLHMLGDALSAFGVVVAGVFVLTIGAPLADPIVSLLIAALILYSTYGSAP